MSLPQTLLLGLIAGGTIALGLPLGRLRSPALTLRFGLDPAFRELATLLSIMQALPDADPHSVIDRLAPMTSPGNPWRSTALELTAAARLEAGDKNGALEVYKTLADDLAAPQGMRARAAEMAAALAS